MQCRSQTREAWQQGSSCVAEVSHLQRSPVPHGQHGAPLSRATRTKIGAQAGGTVGPARFFDFHPRVHQQPRPSSSASWERFLSTRRHQRCDVVRLTSLVGLSSQHLCQSTALLSYNWWSWHRYAGESHTAPNVPSSKEAGTPVPWFGGSQN